MYIVPVALVCLGLALNNMPFEELIGAMWTNWRAVVRDMAIGFGFWLVARYTGKLIHYLTHSRPDKVFGPFPHIWPELGIAVLLAIVAGIVEEIVFRGYLQKQISVLFKSVPAGIFFQAVVFGFWHGYHQSVGTFLVRFSFGVLAGFLAHWRKSLLPGMIGHSWLDAYIEMTSYIHS